MAGYVDTAAKVKDSGTVEFLLKLIPTSFVGAFSSGDVLQVLEIAFTVGKYGVGSLVQLGYRVALFYATVGQEKRPPDSSNQDSREAG